MEASGERDLPSARDEARDAPPYIPDPTLATRSVGPILSPGVTTIGVPRPEQPGTRGVEFTVTTNHFAIKFSDNLIYHYDVTIGKDSPEMMMEPIRMPVKWNHELIRTLQEKIVPTVFTPRAVYDGRKNLFSSRRLPLRSWDGDSQTFSVTLKPPYEHPPPQVYKVGIRLATHVDPMVLKQYCDGQISINNEVRKALTPLNIVLRMKASLTYPFTMRSFLADQEMRPLGAGIELWRGYFRSIRPGIRSLLVKMDTCTGTMYAPGPMIQLCGQILENQSPSALIPGVGLSDRDRLKLQRFFNGVRFVTADPAGRGRGKRKPKVVKKITSQGASSIRFTNSDGREMTIAEYFSSLGVTLLHPRFVCIETLSGAVYPIEFCYILPGQIMRRLLPYDLAIAGMSFMKRTPEERLNSIVAGHNVIGHSTSEYMKSFDMTIDPGPQKCVARMLKAPLLDYGQGAAHRPENGIWNFKDRKVYEPVEVPAWAVVVYDARGLNKADAREAISNLVSQAAHMGIRMVGNPPIVFPPAQATDVAQHLQLAGRQAFQQYHTAPTLLVVILPCYSWELYQAVKHFGNVTKGIATQCLMGTKARGAKEQYWANVCLKINAKLGGINSKLNTFDNPSWIFDPEHPVMVIASRVMHPAPGATGRPSFSAVVGSLDSDAVRYSGAISVSDSRVWIMQDLENMVYELIGRHAWWKTNREKQAKRFPERIVFYHSGVSDNEFSTVLDTELPAIQAACKRHEIDPKITMVIVGRGHHVRFFPTHGTADQSGNCPAGTVVDSVVGNPHEFDFYLQSHSSPVGTSRPAHYSVIYDENDFSQDGIQELTYALCHIGARSTRSLSIPAPLHYADLVSARTHTHFDPSFSPYDMDEGDETGVGNTTTPIAQYYREHLKPLHPSMRNTMYFQ